MGLEMRGPSKISVSFQMVQKRGALLTPYGKYKRKHMLIHPTWKFEKIYNWPDNKYV